MTLSRWKAATLRDIRARMKDLGYDLGDTPDSVVIEAAMRMSKLLRHLKRAKDGVLCRRCGACGYADLRVRFETVADLAKSTDVGARSCPQCGTAAA